MNCEMQINACLKVAEMEGRQRRTPPPQARRGYAMTVQGRRSGFVPWVASASLPIACQRTRVARRSSGRLLY